jgi:hypothetical protein
MTRMVQNCKLSTHYFINLSPAILEDVMSTDETWDDSTCVVCGGHRAHCSWPPVCKSENCRREWQTETEFNRVVEAFEKKILEGKA